MLTKEQKEWRQSGIGGSDMAIILGLSSYKTPFVLFLEKLGINSPVFEESEQQHWGHALEPLIRNHFIEQNNVTVQVPSANEPPLVHPMFDFMLGNIDGYIVEWDAIHEIKCSDKFMRSEWGDAGSDVIPMQYLVQVAHYCAIKNCNKAIISVLIGGNEYREFTYVRDFEIEDRIIQAAKDFWHCVQTQSPPECINIDDLKLRYNTVHELSTVEANDAIATQLNCLQDAKAKQKELNQLEEHYKFEIMNYMKHAECLTDENGAPMVTWKANKKGVRSFLLKGKS